MSDTLQFVEIAPQKSLTKTATTPLPCDHDKLKEPLIKCVNFLECGGSTPLGVRRIEPLSKAIHGELAQDSTRRKRRRAAALQIDA